MALASQSEGLSQCAWSESTNIDLFRNNSTLYASIAICVYMGDSEWSCLLCGYFCYIAWCFNQDLVPTLYACGTLLLFSWSLDLLMMSCLRVLIVSHWASWWTSWIISLPNPSWQDVNCVVVWYILQMAHATEYSIQAKGSSLLSVWFSSREYILSILLSTWRTCSTIAFDCGLWIMDCGLWIADCRLPIADCGY